MRGKLLIASLALLGIAVASPSHATVYAWDFATSTDNGTIGPPDTAVETYTSNTGGYTLQALGFDGATAATGASTWIQGSGVGAHDLYEKYTAGDASETGLGLADSADKEIKPTSFINLDVKNLKDNGLVNLKLKIGSIQTKEDYYVWGSNSSGGSDTAYTLLSGTELDSGTQSTFSVKNSDLSLYRYFTISAKPSSDPNVKSDVLIDNGVSAESVPEASTLIGFGSLLSLGGFAALRTRKKTA